MNEKELSNQKEDTALADTEKAKKRSFLTLKVSIVLIFIGALGFLYWFFFVRLYISTDDAYVQGNLVNLVSSEEGICVAIYTDNTQYVTKGQLLVELDDHLYQLAFDKSKVNLALATRQVRQLAEEVNQREADVLLKEALLEKAKGDFENRRILKDTLAISKEDFLHVIAELKEAEASLQLAMHQLESAKVSLGGTHLWQHPLIEDAKIALKNAYISLYRCKILAPVSGFIAQRAIQVGESVNTTRPLMSIIPLEQIWIDANFKETQLERLRIGQPVTIESDLYGSDIIYQGKLEGIVAGTGSIFSLLPPQNATGNWIKIVQRVPVRIRFDEEDLKKYPLFLGLSTNVVVNTANIQGERLAQHPVLQPQFVTQVFDVPMAEIDMLIEQIITENL